MNLTAFFSVLIALKMISFLASWFATKRSSSQEDYYLAGRNISFFPLTITLIGIVLGGGSVLGAAEEAFKFGWSFLFFPLGFCIGFILISIGSGKKLQKLKIFTIAQIFEIVYHSTTLKKIASLLSIASLYLILVVQIAASKKFLLGFGIDSSFIFFFFWSCVSIYAVMGGFKAVITSHVIQTIFFIAILFIAIYFAISHNPRILFESLSVGMIKTSHVEISKMLGWLLMPIFFFLISQDVGQRCFAAKSSKVVTSSTISAGICLLLVMSIPIFFGNIATLLNISPKEEGSVLMTVLSYTTSPLITSLVGSGFIAAVTSSVESLINAISSNIFNDFNLDKYLKKIGSVKWIALIIAISAIGVAWVCTSIIDLVIISYEMLICTLFVSVFISFFRLKGNTISALYSVVIGAVSLLYFRVVLKSPPVGYQLICLLGSFFAFYLGELQVKFLKNTPFSLQGKDDNEPF